MLYSIKLQNRSLNCFYVIIKRITEKLTTIISIITSFSILENEVAKINKNNISLLKIFQDFKILKFLELLYINKLS